MPERRNLVTAASAVAVPTVADDDAAAAVAAETAYRVRSGAELEHRLVDAVVARTQRIAAYDASLSPMRRRLLRFTRGALFYVIEAMAFVALAALKHRAPQIFWIGLIVGVAVVAASSTNIYLSVRDAPDAIYGGAAAHAEAIREVRTSLAVMWTAAAFVLWLV